MKHHRAEESAADPNLVLMSNRRWSPALCRYLGPGGPLGGGAAGHRVVGPAVAPVQAVLPGPGGPAHTVQHPPHLRGGLLSGAMHAGSSCNHARTQTHTHAHTHARTHKLRRMNICVIIHTFTQTILIYTHTQPPIHIHSYSIPFCM